MPPTASDAQRITHWVNRDTVAGARNCINAQDCESGARPGTRRYLRANCLHAALAAAVLALAACGARAQSAVLDAYQERDGLTNMKAECLTQEPRGTLWICTENGLFRFDGFHFHREPLPAPAGHLIVYALADRLGRLWVETETGLYLRREVDNALRWSAVSTADGKGLMIDRSHRLDVDEHGNLFAMDMENRLWSVAVPVLPSPAPVAQPVAVPAFAPFEKTREARSGPVLAVGNALWFGCGSGLCLWQSGQLRTWGPAQGLPSGAWSALLLARDGSLWTRSSSHLARLAPLGDRFTTLDAPSAIKWAGTIALVEDPTGAILTATDDGVARWDGRRWQTWTQREGMPETAVHALLFDAEGSLWLGIHGRGLQRWIGYGAVDHWTPATGLPHPAVVGLARGGDGRLWASTPKGVAWLDESAHMFRALHSSPAADGAVWSLAVDASGSLWWVDDGKLMMLRPAETRPQVISADAHLGRVVQGNADVYLATPRGAQRLMPLPPYLRREPALAAMQEAQLLHAVISDGTHEWFQAGRHLCLMEGNKCEELHDMRGASIDISNTAAFAGASELWADDDTGISVYSVHDAVARLVRRIDESSFGGAAINHLRSDTAGRIWMGTDRGLFVFDEGNWSHIDRTNGLVWNDIDGASLVDPDGTAWIGTNAGVTQIHPGMKRTTAPALRLDELEFGTHTAYTAPRAPIAWADRRIRITVGTPSIGRGRGTRLEYRLHRNEPWQTVDGNEIQFESLESDSYHLEVRAAARLPIDEPGTALQIPFEVAPPWWASVPARLGYAAALAASWYITVLVLRRRAAATRRRLHHAIAERTSELESSRESLRELGEYNARSLEAERKRVSRELHDEMGQQLAALRMEVSVARMRINANQSVGSETLDTLLERVDRIVASVRTLVSQLRPPALDAGLLPAIEWLAAEFTRSTGIPCELALDAGARDLPADAATMVFRIIQESLTNVRRHAAARRVSVALRPEARRWELRVSDDGNGFDAAQPRSGHGLLGMSERARVLGGALTITSAPGAGTTIRLVLGPAHIAD